MALDLFAPVTILLLREQINHVGVFITGKSVNIDACGKVFSIPGQHKLISVNQSDQLEAVSALSGFQRGVRVGVLTLSDFSGI